MTDIMNFGIETMTKEEMLNAGKLKQGSELLTVVVTTGVTARHCHGTLMYLSVPRLSVAEGDKGKAIRWHL